MKRKPWLEGGGYSLALCHHRTVTTLCALDVVYSTKASAVWWVEKIFRASAHAWEPTDLDSNSSSITFFGKLLNFSELYVLLRKEV